MKLRIALLASAMAFGLAACDSSKDDSQASAPAAAPAATTPQEPTSAPAPEQTDVTPAPAESTEDTAPAGSITIGIPECDEFLTAVKSCINSTVPADQRETQMKQIDEMATMWQSLPKGSLAPMCKQAHDTAKTTYSAYGCSF